MAEKHTRLNGFVDMKAERDCGSGSSCSDNIVRWFVLLRFYRRFVYPRLRLSLVSSVQDGASIGPVRYDNTVMILEGRMEVD